MGQQNSQDSQYDEKLINQFQRPQEFSSVAKAGKSDNKFASRLETKRSYASGSSTSLSSAEGKQLKWASPVSTLSRPTNNRAKDPKIESTRGHLVFSNKNIFEGFVCASQGSCEATFLTHEGESLKGNWIFFSFRYAPGSFSPLAIYDTDIVVTTSDSQQVRYTGKILIELKSGRLHLPNQPKLLKTHSLPVFEERQQKKELTARSESARTSSNSRNSKGQHPVVTCGETGNYLKLATMNRTKDGLLKNSLFSKLVPNDIAEFSCERSAQEKYKEVFSKLYGKDKLDSRWDDEINIDLNRSSFALFCEHDAKMVQKVTADILKYAARSFPSIGYCQGMDYVVKYVLTFFYDPRLRNENRKSEARNAEDGFVFLSLLLTDSQYRMADLFKPGFQLLHALLDEFDTRLAKVEPILQSHLEKNQVLPVLYATKWFLTVFCFYADQDWNGVNNVWIRFLSQGWDAIIDVAVACVSGVKELLLNADMENCLHVLSGNSKFTLRGLLNGVFNTERGQATLLRASQYRRGSEYIHEHAAAYSLNVSNSEEALPFTCTRKPLQSVTAIIRRRTTIG